MSGPYSKIKNCNWSTETLLVRTVSVVPPPSFFFYQVPPSSSLLFISEIIVFFPFTETNPRRRINYFTSGTELSHCEQHIAGINAHQLAKLCALSKWVAGFRGNRDSRRPLHDYAVVLLVSKSATLCFTFNRAKSYCVSMCCQWRT